MKNISTALQTLFSTSTTFLMADLYTITLVTGQILAYTSADVTLGWSGNTYTCLGPKVSRDQVKTIVGVQVDSLDITFFPETTDLVLGNPFLNEVIAGVFDGAWIKLDRAFLTAWNTASIVGTVNMFSGMVSTCLIGRTSAKITVKSPLELLNINTPRNVYQAGCMHNLFDLGCGLNSASWTIGGVVGAGPTPGAINSNMVVPGVVPAQWITLGYVIFNNGVLIGQSRGVVAFNNTGGIAFSYPFNQAPGVGDSFTAYPGCDKQQSTCTTKFNNLIHFRGFPYIPVPETAV